MKDQLTPVLILLTLFITGLTACGDIAPEPAGPEYKLWYDQPADATLADDKNGWKDDPHWLSALPLGNGSLGIMVFGDVHQERLQLNEESMWSGSPDDNDNPAAREALDSIRQLLFAGKYREASALTQQTQVCKGAGSGHGNGSTVPFGSFQTLGDLHLDFGTDGAYQNYQRELDLQDAVARVSYELDGVQYQREIFTSQPDQVMVARFTADQAGKISFHCTLDRPERFLTAAERDQLVMRGSLNDGKGGNGLEYVIRVKALTQGGEVSYQDTTLTVSNADEVVLLLSASTDYQLNDPEFSGRDYEALTQQNIDAAAAKSYESLLADHKAEYDQYYDRLQIALNPQDSLQRISTDARLAAYKDTQRDPYLEALMFQYGRYLLISSSRPGTLPANLQGIWSNKLQTPWNGDYHTDVNIEMNYWPAEVTNLSEMHLPYFDLLASLTEPGSKTARIHYGAEGWVVHPITNVWGYTSPGEAASWGMHTGAGAWMCQHILEHYRFTGDRQFLENMFPVLEGSARFYLDWLVPHPETGALVSGPAVSPENTFIAPDSSRSQISMGPAHDQQVIWQLFSDYLQAAEVLELDTELTAAISQARGQLAGPSIGSDGRLMEWAEEWEEVEPGHRHISHLFALHPGAQISSLQTPELAAAAGKSLDHRIANGGGHTGWSAAWLILQYARLQEAAKAKHSLETVISKSTSTNLFGQHPPFQMDANFGYTAGVAEMLLQSHAGVIHLLPALPAAWSNGWVRGLRARGGYTVDLEWENGQLLRAHIKADRAGKSRVQYGDQVQEVDIAVGDVAELEFGG
ncbi:glycoside hydrolase family 95 protein [Flavilitoribacter nigricans]|uniref:Alpha-L-fucosidase n=1 Tax=Flavilitoribacter nigricans (strain ATCC 23147 / DSM 23189 / NBRC 102662 / NCIMB 1420 / SS-2) TaxID=1122177 RepID=A0A2D0N484_FLAN2|nr:glycoside hydrolase family 95 protein [Flavilitoribacter nigricans]PHN03314.1 alpha-L-fucosidase [Flavilitoribacter nigricans DSM 23189 = NBRC 102662]